jgi:hypothetical protein
MSLYIHNIIDNLREEKMNRRHLFLSAAAMLMLSAVEELRKLRMKVSRQAIVAIGVSAKSTLMFHEH